MANEQESLPEGGENNGPEMSPTEAQAREQGWVPKEEFHGEEHKWVDAGEFLRRGELFGKIESQNKELKAIRETLLQFKDHHSKVQEAAYKKAIQDLKAKKKEALLESDADLVIEVDEQLAEVRQAQAAINSQPKIAAPQEEHPEFIAFKQKNSWYENNRKMRLWADDRGLELARSGMSPSEVLRTVEREVRQDPDFKHVFENPNRNKAGAVEGAPRRGGSGVAAYEPSEIERKMAQKFVREGLFKNEKEYYDELRSM